MTELNTPGPEDTEDARVVPFAVPRPRRAPDDDPATAPDTGPDTPPDVMGDGPVLEGNVIRVDQPGHDRPDWLADLAARTRDRRPIIHPALRSRREALATARWLAEHYRHVSLLPPGPRPEVRGQARRPRPARLHPHGVRAVPVGVRPGGLPGPGGHRAAGRPRGLPEAVPPARFPRPAPRPDLHPGRDRRGGGPGPGPGRPRRRSSWPCWPPRWPSSASSAPRPTGR